MKYESLLKEMQKIRKAKGISLRKLGKELGVSAQMLSLIERGKTPLKVQEYCQICAIIGVSPSELIAEQERD